MVTGPICFSNRKSVDGNIPWRWTIVETVGHTLDKFTIGGVSTIIVEGMIGVNALTH